VSRRSGNLVRLALLLVLAAAIAGVAATVAHALQFDDGSPCPRASGQVFVCPMGTVGGSYSIVLKSSGGCGPALPYQYRVLNGALPPGVSVSSGGTISGTPTAAGTYDFELELSDQNPPSAAWCLPKTAQQPFRISINSGLQIVTNDIPQSASVGVPYSATLQAQIVTGLNPTTGSAATGATWSVPSYGTGLPPGLSLADGVISGTPTTEGAYTFRIQASLNGASHFQTYSLTVRQPLTLAASKPLATTPAPTLWETGVPFSAKLTPAGGNGTYTFAIADGALPTGLALAADGTLAGTPTVAGVSKATIRVTDGEGRTLDYPAGFGIAKRLAVSTLLLKPGKVGRAYHTRLSTTGGLPPKTWRAITGKLPRGVKLDRQLGVLSGVPTKAGTYKVTFQATDGLKVAATKTLKIVVLPASR
jgi:large repetitive protein